MGLINKQIGHSETNEPAATEQAETPEIEAQEEASGVDNDEGMEEPGEGGSILEDAMRLVQETLYSKGAAKQLAQAIRSADDPVDALANAAYEIVSMVDQREQGAIPDEDLAEFAMRTLSEVCEVAEQAGVPVSGQTVAQALQIMIRRYLNDNGMDSQQIEAAMAQMDPAAAGAQMDAAAQEV